MILKKLIMHNFGIYESTNRFDFSCKGPVVLIGGMNGRGKTTFLEAVLLGLYGINSFAYIESKYKTYGQYLRAHVNDSDRTLETFVEIEFSIKSIEEETYCVRRDWNAKNQRIHERIEVKKNGEFSKFLTENWPMFVENILPSALSNFFFFDGEKIAEIAVENTNEQMKESIKALLGISVLDFLEKDLNRIIHKLSEKELKDQDFVRWEQQRKKKENAQEELKAVDDDIKRLQEKIEDLAVELEKKNAEYSIKGGGIVEQKQDLVRKRSEYMLSMEKHTDVLLEQAAGRLPLLLVVPLLKDIEKQGELERAYRTSLLAVQKVKSLYMDFIKMYPNTSDEMGKFVKFIQDDNELYDNEEIYGLSDAELYQITRLIREGLKKSADQVDIEMKRRNLCREKIKEIDNYLSIEIDEKSLNRVFRQIKQLEKEITIAEVDLESLQQKRAVLFSVAKTMGTEFRKMAEMVLDSLETSDDDQRTVKYAHMAIEIIKRYRIQLQRSKTKLLAKTMMECYKKLANKKNLIMEIKMDPETLDLHYMNREGGEVEKKSLSAGEKQLMVISLLWALAICSKKKLPVIIDTPLSRLDSIHREALITVYFPNASDQTIILSTDSEIDEKYYELMKPSIGDEFTLVYDDVLKKTSIREGYFSFGGKE